MKMELVFIPSPGAGHLRPLVEVAKLLVDRDDHLSVTIIIIPQMQGFGSNSSSSYIASLPTTSSKRLRYNVLSVPETQTSDDPKPNFLTYIEGFKPQVKTIVEKLIDPAAQPESQLAGFVIDMFCTTMIDVANEFCVPSYMFYTSNATFLGLQIHAQYLLDVEKYDVSDLNDSEVTELKVPSLTRPLPVKCLPSVMLSKEWLPRIISQTRRIRETKGILVNTFAELEPQAMKFLSGGGDHPLPTVYPVGPVLNIKINGPDSADDKQSEILRWLDEQPAKSVVFLCFGSMGGFREEQAKEIAIALERSGYRFLWSLRRAQTKGTMGPLGEFTNLEEILPEGFLDRTVEIGKIIGWAPQSAVLANPAIGGFVSHCGWNSTLESLWFGVPMATWPLYAEQTVNAFEMVEELGLAVEIRNHFRGDFMATEADLMTADEIDRGIRCLMEKDSDVRDRVNDMSEKSHVALMDGGSSHTALLKFIQDVTKNIS